MYDRDSPVYQWSTIGPVVSSRSAASWSKVRIPSLGLTLGFARLVITIWKGLVTSAVAAALAAAAAAAAAAAVAAAAAATGVVLRFVVLCIRFFLLLLLVLC